MELFDKKFVHFMWDDELKGKKCFLSNYIGALRFCVEKGDERDFEVEKSNDVDEPFQAKDGIYFTFAYYDPNYSVKWAYYKEGKKVQCKSCGEWVDCDTYPLWEDGCQYRVKPDCPCEDGIDSKACVGCKHSEDGKPEEKKYRPYESSAEMIADFIDRFKVDCPSYAEPSIWVKGQSTDNRYLVTDIFPEDGVRLGGRHYSFTELFSCYTYLNGSPCGTEVRE